MRSHMLGTRFRAVFRLFDLGAGLNGASSSVSCRCSRSLSSLGSLCLPTGAPDPCAGRSARRWRISSHRKQRPRSRLPVSSVPPKLVDSSTTNQLQKAEGLPLQSSTACRKALAKRSARSGAMKYNQRCSLEKGLPMRAFVTVFSAVAVMTFLSLVAVSIRIPIFFSEPRSPVYDCMDRGSIRERSMIVSLLTDGPSVAQS